MCFVFPEVGATVAATCQASQTKQRRGVYCETETYDIHSKINFTLQREGRTKTSWCKNEHHRPPVTHHSLPRKKQRLSLYVFLILSADGGGAPAVPAGKRRRLVPPPTQRISKTSEHTLIASHSDVTSFFLYFVFSKYDVPSPVVFKRPVG